MDMQYQSEIQIRRNRKKKLIENFYETLTMCNAICIFRICRVFMYCICWLIRAALAHDTRVKLSIK